MIAHTYLLGTAPSILHILSYLVPGSTLWNMYYYHLHRESGNLLKGSKLERQRWKDLNPSVLDISPTPQPWPRGAPSLPVCTLFHSPAHQIHSSSPGVLAQRMFITKKPTLKVRRTSGVFHSLFLVSCPEDQRTSHWENKRYRKRQIKEEKFTLGLRNRWCRGLGGAEAWLSPHRQGRGQEMLLRNPVKVPEESRRKKLKIFNFQNRRFFFF